MAFSAVHQEVSSEWDAAFYHGVMGAQQVGLARRLFELLPTDLSGLVIDGGCGSGPVDHALLEQFPEAHLLAFDLSAQMLTLARRELLPAFEGRVSFQQDDLQTFVQPASATCFFSNAAMHWVRDHDAMFEHIASTLLPGGVLATHMAWCGPLNSAWFQRMRALLRTPRFAAYGAEAMSDIERISPSRERRALLRAGFSEIRVEADSHAFFFDDAAQQRLFYEKVVLRTQVERLPLPLRTELIDAAIAYADATAGPLTQQFEFLRCTARRPTPT
ncbi:MAG TPA: methyltransferase domain-containing protein [Myxococcota bacterium]|nr:methyltransferase domain-containing protein [Myxococcota bacterium]